MNLRHKILNAFDLAIEKIGFDVMSYSIWLDYANFVKSM